MMADEQRISYVPLAAMDQRLETVVGANGARLSGGQIQRLGLALMLLTTPILLPIIVNLGLSPIWFGIYLVRTMEIGFVHPPIGINLYVIQGIAKDTPLSRIFKGVVPFLAADFVHLSCLIAFPALALALPGWLAQ